MKGRIGEALHSQLPTFMVNAPVRGLVQLAALMTTLALTALALTVGACIIGAICADIVMME